ncbi:hypothetical protein ACLB1E_31060 [Escherichia coli]
MIRRKFDPQPAKSMLAHPPHSSLHPPIAAPVAASALDELTFREALLHLINEFAFSERGIHCQFAYQLNSTPENETVQLPCIGYCRSCSITSVNTPKPAK